MYGRRCRTAATASLPPEVAGVFTPTAEGEIDNAVGVIALQWLALHRDEVRARWK